jgi:four helix bundle protein
MSSVIREKSFEAAVKIYQYCKFLQDQQREFVISKQLLRSGTSVGAQVREAANGESTRDFVHKLQIAQKECDETMYWLEILQTDEKLEKQKITELKNDFEEVLKILKSIIKTTKEKYKL